MLRVARVVAFALKIWWRRARRLRTLLVADQVDSAHRSRVDTAPESDHVAGQSAPACRPHRNARNRCALIARAIRTAEMISQLGDGTRLELAWVRKTPPLDRDRRRAVLRLAMATVSSVVPSGLAGSAALGLDNFGVLSNLSTCGLADRTAYRSQHRSSCATYETTPMAQP